MASIRYAQAESGNIDLLLYADIGTETASAKAVASLLDANPDAKVITVRINSVGGDAFDGLAIHRLLQRHPAQVVVEIDGVAASAAAIIAMAGDVIRMSEGGAIMVHETSTMSQGQVKDLLRDVASLEALNKAQVNIFTKRTGLPADKVVEMLAAETWMSAEEAQEMGFADEIAGRLNIAASARNSQLWKAQDMPEEEKPAAEAVEEEKPEAISEDDVVGQDEEMQDEEAQPVDFNAFGAAIAEATGLDPAAALAILQDSADEIAEAIKSKVAQDGTPAEEDVAQAEGDEPEGEGDESPEARFARIELKAAGERLAVLEDEARARKEAEQKAEVDRIINEGYALDSQREDVEWAVREDIERARRIYAHKVVPVGDPITPEMNATGDVPLESLDKETRLIVESLKAAKYGDEKKCIAKALASRKEMN